jgi:hypothetical protein
MPNPYSLEEDPLGLLFDIQYAADVPAPGLTGPGSNLFPYDGDHGHIPVDNKTQDTPPPVHD